MIVAFGFSKLCNVDYGVVEGMVFFGRLAKRRFIPELGSPRQVG